MKPFWQDKRDRAKAQLRAGKVTSLVVREIIRGHIGAGGYHIFAVTNDGGVLCVKCLRTEYRQIAYAMRHRLRDGWCVDGFDHTGNCESLTGCDNCDTILWEES